MTPAVRRLSSLFPSIVAHADSFDSFDSFDLESSSHSLPVLAGHRMTLLRLSRPLRLHLRRLRHYRYTMLLFRNRSLFLHSLCVLRPIDVSGFFYLFHGRAPCRVALLGIAGLGRLRPRGLMLLLSDIDWPRRLTSGRFELFLVRCCLLTLLAACSLPGHFRFTPKNKKSDFCLVLFFVFVFVFVFMGLLLRI